MYAVMLPPAANGKGRARKNIWLADFDVYTVPKIIIENKQAGRGKG